MTESKVVEWVPDGAVAEAAASVPQWDGTRTTLTMSRNVYRGDVDANGKPTNPYLVGRNEKITFRAAFDKGTRRWIGPEGRHVESLIAMGSIQSTTRSNELDAEAATLEHERGAWDGNPDGSAQHPELRQLTRDQMHDLLRRHLDMSLDARRAAENLDRRTPDEGHAEALNNLADAIRNSKGGFDAQNFLGSLSDEQADALATALTARTRTAEDPLDNKGEWAGAQGPGTHLTARKRRAAQEES